MNDWLSDNWLEIFGAITGGLYIYLSIKENILLWLVGIISCTVYVVVFYDSKFYADMSLQVYYVIISIYGWYNWARKKKITDKEFKVLKIPKRHLIIYAVATFLLFVAIGYSLDKFTDSPLPYGDSLTTSLGIVATYMLTKKYIEQWVIWIIVDFIAAGMYFYKELFPTAILYVIFAIMAIVGYKEWKKSMLNEHVKT